MQMDVFFLRMFDHKCNPKLQVLALQHAVWGISCLVLLSSCIDSSLHSSFSK